MIEGTARLPNAQLSVWILVEVVGIHGWWPQGGGSVRITDGQWKALTYFGGPDDVGGEFVVYAIVADLRTTQELQQWFDRANQTGQYPPLASFPSAVIGCPVRSMKVLKTSH